MSLAEECASGGVSFLMLKPDCLASTAMTEVVYTAVKSSARMSLTSEVDRVLTRADLEYCWPHLVNPQNPVTSAFLSCYLLNRRVRLLVARGPGAVDEMKAIKQKLRRTYAIGCFANLLHGPADLAEALAQLSWFGVTKALGEPGSLSPPLLDRNGIWGRASTLPSVDIAAIVDRTWLQATTQKWSSLVHAARGSGDARLVLRDDEANTVDFVLSSLLHVIETWDLETALQAVLHADREGECELLRGPADGVTAMGAQLGSLGVAVRVEVG